MPKRFYWIMGTVISLTIAVVLLAIITNLAKPVDQDANSLEVAPLELHSETNCTSARLFPKNDVTESQGNGISFRADHTVKIVFENSGCGEIRLDQGSLQISQNIELIGTIGNPAESVIDGESREWTWNQRNMNGEQVGDGQYEFSIQTNIGEYRVTAQIFSDN